MRESGKPEKNDGAKSQLPAARAAAAMLGISEFNAGGKAKLAKSGKFGKTLGVPTPLFWDSWKSHKEIIKDAGLAIWKTPEGKWAVSFWSDDPDGFERFAEVLVNSAKPDKDESIAVRILAAQKTLLATKKTGIKTKAKTAKSKPRMLAAAADTIPEVVSGLTLRPYQRIGAGFLAGRKNALLADDMGLGKTIQALAAVVSLPKTPSSILILCPVSVAGMWRGEAAKALPSHDVAVCDSPDKVKAADEAIGQNTVVVMPYSRVAKFKTRHEFDLVISDETHYLKNPQAKRSRQAWEIRTRRWWALSGTPVLNHAIDIQPLLEKFGDDAGEANCSHKEFAKRFCFVREGRYGLQFLAGTDEQVERLRMALEPIMLRRTKLDVLDDLPAKVYTNHICDDSAITKAAKAEDAVIGGGSRSSKILSDIKKNTELMSLRRLTAQAKAVVTAELAVDAAQSGPIVVFSHFKEAQKILIEKIHRSKLKVAAMTADLDTASRDKIVREFQDGQYNVAVASGGAFREGVTLTHASTVIFNDLDWTPQNNLQAEDRLHRIGQAESVHVVRVLTDHGVDEIIMKVLSGKEIEIKRIGLSSQRPDGNVPAKAESEMVRNTASIPHPRSEMMNPEEFNAQMRSFADKCENLRQSPDIPSRMARALKKTAATFRRAVGKSPQNDHPSINGSLSVANRTLLNAWRAHSGKDSVRELVGTLLREMADFRKEFKRNLATYQSESLPPPSERTEIYCDGGCYPNPGPGAWAVCYKDADDEWVDRSEFLPSSTNNRAELLAAIEAVKIARDITAKHPIIVSDSQYIVNGITEWALSWERNGWRTKAKGRPPVENQDLWKQLLLLQKASDRHISWQWIKGHSGNAGNERADWLAGVALQASRGATGRR